MQFVGEHLLPGQLGHFFVITSFIAALLSAFSYFMSARIEAKDAVNSRSWMLLGRAGFLVHFTGIISVFSVLYYIITNHLFEYHYAWEHSSLDMPMKYLLSCFWEGQQGSFMLWAFWHGVLGLVVMQTAKTLETRTMAIIALIQVFLCSMLLGFYFSADWKIGSTPFDLLRNAMSQAPIFSNPNYLQFVKDGNGLNVLLQNYWMVIHPPILFLGFATTLIPFAYCIAALWKGEYQLFIKPALNWTLFNGAVLGLGIMMGGAWAYESLNFGGYWAWDPVENASLVPWLTLIAGLHTLLEYKSSGRALPATLILLVLTHLLIWYSTFLTRTGILGTTSVHAFTGDGTALMYHLIFVMCLLLLMVIAFLAYRWRNMPRIKTEEETFTREFWLFVGSVILLLSSLQIIISTSIPVWAPLYKCFSGKNIAPSIDPMSHYNNIQVWIAIVIGLVSGSALFLKYKHTDSKTLLKQLLIPTIVALLLTAIIGFNQKISQFQYVLMLFSACYGITTSISFGISIQKVKLKKMGASVAHLGFALILMGILLSSYNKEIITKNSKAPGGSLSKMGRGMGNKNDNSENVVLPRNKAVNIGDYEATYLGDSDVHGKDLRVYYKVDFSRKKGNSVEEKFSLYPDAFINPKGQQGLSANPATQHYWNKDIFTFITSISAPGGENEGFNATVVSKTGDTIYADDKFLVFNGFQKGMEDNRYGLNDSDLGVLASLTVYDYDGHSTKTTPLYVLRNKMYPFTPVDTLSSMGLFIKFNRLIVNEAGASAEIMVKHDSYIVLKAYVFPYINVLWLGVIVMVIGFFTSIYGRISFAGRGGKG